MWHHLFLEFWLVDTWLLAYWRYQRAATRLENVRQLNIRQGKKLGFKLFHRWSLNNNGNCSWIQVLIVQKTSLRENLWAKNTSLTCQETLSYLFDITQTHHLAFYITRQQLFHWKLPRFEGGTKIQTGTTCKKILCYMRDSACTWLIVQNAEIFWSYVKHFWILPRERNCRILIG